jgi:AraC-like DNA-binding protein
MTRDLRFQAEILQGSAEQPFLSFVLQMPCEIVTEIHTTLKDSQPASYRIEPLPPQPEAFVTALDQDLLSAVRRFLLALKSKSESKVLAPMYLREIIYRLLRAEQHLRLLESAADEQGDSTITASIHFMRQEMHQKLTVRDLAEAVSMSESSFAHSFKAATGLPPLQFLKQIRLERARKLLLNGNNVSETAAKVSYTSLSHFIFEFKRQFGAPPKTYAKRFQNLQ